MGKNFQRLVLLQAAVISFVCVYLLFQRSHYAKNLKSAIPSLDPNIPIQVVSLSKDVVIHSSYFDARPRDGHKNVTILIMNVNKTILDSDWILGCGVDNIRAKYFSVYSIFENELMHGWLGTNPVLYENHMILCYDMPSKNGSKVFATYKTSENATVELVTFSRQPLFYPAPRVKPSNGDDFTVVVCSKVHNKKAPWFREFIQYQRAIGVDHIDFSVLDTFIKDDGYDQMVLKDLVVQKAVQEGFINFRVWPETYEKEGEAYFHSENLRKLGCMYRYLGTYDYAMPLDTDDFFVPRTNQTKLKSYIKKYYYSKPAGSCQFTWVRYFPDCGMNGKVGPNGNVTDHLENKVVTQVGNFKSVHSTKAILDASFHDARCPKCLMPGYKMVWVPDSEAYVAHIRFGINKKDRKTICRKI